MRTVTALDVRKHLGELLDAASAGERILIERDHRPMAVLVSVEDAERLDQVGETREERVARVEAAMARLDALAKEMAKKRPPGAPDAVTSIRLDREERTDQILRAATGGRYVPPPRDEDPEA
ncbi:MAG: type II toxin-antitoxin system Phd/YefM family antitoxin [Chloroflexota bacterium]